MLCWCQPLIFRVFWGNAAASCWKTHQQGSTAAHRRSWDCSVACLSLCDAGLHEGSLLGSFPLQPGQLTLLSCHQSLAACLRFLYPTTACQSWPQVPHATQDLGPLAR